MAHYAIVDVDGNVLNVIQGDPAGDDRGAAIPIPDDSPVQGGDLYADGKFIADGGTLPAPADPVQERLAALESHNDALTAKLVEKAVITQKDADDIATAADVAVAADIGTAIP